MKGRKPKLSREQADQMFSEYELGRRHSPKQLCAKWGLSITTFRQYIYRGIKQRTPDGHAS